MEKSGPRNVSEQRQAAYKNRGALKADELRRRREDAAVEIRKAKREESLAKRRNLVAVSGGVSESEDEDQASATMQVCFGVLTYIYRQTISNSNFIITSSNNNFLL